MNKTTNEDHFFKNCFGENSEGKEGIFFKRFEYASE